MHKKIITLTVWILIFLFVSEDTSVSADFCSIEFRKVIDNHKEELDNGEAFSYIDNSGKLETIHVEKYSEIIIPSKLITDIKFNVYEARDGEYMRNANGPIIFFFDISLHSKMKDFIKNSYGKRIAILICNKLMIAPEAGPLGIPELEEKTDSWMLGYYKKSLDREIALIKNLGITPHYRDIYAKFGKPTYKEVIKNFKIKPPFNETKAIYPVILSESEFWVTREESEVYAHDNRLSIKVPKGFMVEQMFSPKTFTWEYGKEFIKIVNPYGTGGAWINRNDLIPFFSVLDTDSFLGTFFINNEYEWQIINGRKEFYTNYYTHAEWSRIESVRKLYIKEAKARFINEEEFKKWYLDTFGKQFVD